MNDPIIFSINPSFEQISLLETAFGTIGDVKLTLAIYRMSTCNDYYSEWQLEKETPLNGKNLSIVLSANCVKSAGMKLSCKRASNQQFIM
jgi:hypothetical protein